MRFPYHNDLTRYLRVLPDPGDIPYPPSEVAHAEHWQAQYAAAWWYLKTFTRPGILAYSRPLSFDWAKHRVEKLAGFYVCAAAAESAAADLRYASNPSDPNTPIYLFEFAWRCSALAAHGRRCHMPSVAHRQFGGGDENWLPRCDLHQHPREPGATDPALWSQLETVREHLEGYLPPDYWQRRNYPPIPAETDLSIGT